MIHYCMIIIVDLRFFFEFVNKVYYCILKPIIITLIIMITTLLLPLFIELLR